MRMFCLSFGRIGPDREVPPTPGGIPELSLWETCPSVHGLMMRKWLRTGTEIDVSFIGRLGTSAITYGTSSFLGHSHAEG